MDDEISSSLGTTVLTLSKVGEEGVWRRMGELMDSELDVLNGDSGVSTSYILLVSMMDRVVETDEILLEVVYVVVKGVVVLLLVDTLTLEEL